MCTGVENHKLPDVRGRSSCSMDTSFLAVQMRVVPQGYGFPKRSVVLMVPEIEDLMLPQLLSHYAMLAGILSFFDVNESPGSDHA